jgi:hypothetical protein
MVCSTSGGLEVDLREVEKNMFPSGRWSEKNQHPLTLWFS